MEVTLRSRSIASAVTILSLLATLALVPSALAQDPEAPGPPHETNLTPGEPPPSSFTLSSVHGEPHDLESLRGDRALMIVFFRGTW